MKITVSLSLNIYNDLTYDFIGDEERIFVGLRVIVPVGNQLRTGWITGLNSEYSGRVKRIIGVINDSWKPSKSTMNFVDELSDIYLISKGSLLDNFLLPGRKNIKDIYTEVDGKIVSVSKLSVKYLSENSKKTPIDFRYKKEIEYSAGKVLPSKKFGKKYLEGVSRFKEYEIIINNDLKEGKSVLIIVPDKLSIEYFKREFPNIDVYNSSLKKSEKERVYKKYYEGNDSGVIVGSLSAIFLQIKNLGTVIYERGNTIYANRGVFNGERDYKLLSVIKAKSEHCGIYIGSPSIDIENYRDNMKNISFDSEQKNLINIIRVKKKNQFGDIIQLVKNNLDEKKKTLILINKKKSENILYCQKCKKAVKCDNCDRYIRSEDKDIKKCPSCKHIIEFKCKICGSKIEFIGGVSMDSILRILKEEVTNTDILNISADDTKNIDALQERINKNEIVISTPFIIGNYFKDVFDGVIYYKPETVFDMDSHNAGINIYALLSELKNMTKKGGSIEVISVYHFFYALKLINEEEEFLNRELKYREWFMLPPFYFIYEIAFKEKSLRNLGKNLRDFYLKNHEKLNIKKIYLESRNKNRGLYRGIVIAHTKPSELIKTKTLNKRNISVKLLNM